MNIRIPHIIHQIWSGHFEPLPSVFARLSETWKKNYPEWEYIFWEEKSINRFLTSNYPQYISLYNDFPYDIQRWDVIRYLILYKLGGMYVDFDYECIKDLSEILDGSCCFAQEPEAHVLDKKYSCYFNNALMASVPKAPFMKKIIDTVFKGKSTQGTEDHFSYVLETTGPRMLTALYEVYDKKEEVFIIPAKYVSPFSRKEVSEILQDQITSTLEDKLQKAYAVHYFAGTWLNESKEKYNYGRK